MVTVRSPLQFHTKRVRARAKHHKNVIVDTKKKREIRFITSVREWTTEIESLFWIDDPENEVSIKSTITERIKKRLEAERILPPIPGFMRRDFMKNKENKENI